MYDIETNIFDNNLPRKSQIIIAQLRIGFSDLNAHLYNKGCTNVPSCECGYIREDIRHFMLLCPLYNILRQNMLANLSHLNLNVPITLKLILYGNSHRLSSEQNCNILNHVSHFLLESNRFLNYIH